MTSDILPTYFGLAELKVEGRMTVSLKDDKPLPKLPPSYICTSINFCGTIMTRKEYNNELIKTQPFYG